MSTTKNTQIQCNSQAVGWKKQSKVADHWVPVDGATDGTVECTLSPRHCKIKPGKFGFCGVRGNVDGELHTFNWGKSVSATQERIETEAVNHHSPNAKILSLGNIGCMMCCDFCQNWETSQVQHLNDNSVNKYTPQQIIDICLSNGINIISWTYNDPVVWHEFVKETSILAKQNGIKTLYKSAFYIERKPVEELLEYIDIFSISLKSMDQKFYRKSGGELIPVLERIRQVYDAGKHLEISQLIVTGRNDNEVEIQKTIDWVISTLDKNVPLHFVAFHPAYKYVDTIRTNPNVLLRARELALASGIQYCYIGNVYENGMSDTNCPSCSHTLIKRYGLSSQVIGISQDGECTSCGLSADVLYPFSATEVVLNFDETITTSSKDFLWDEEVKAIHIELSGSTQNSVNILVRHLETEEIQHFRLDGGLKRIIVSKGDHDSSGVSISWNQDADLRYYPVLDRAHFPVVENIDVSLMGVKERKAL